MGGWEDGDGRWAGQEDVLLPCSPTWSTEVLVSPMIIHRVLGPPGTPVHAWTGPVNRAQHPVASGRR